MQLIALKQWDHSLDKNIESIVGNLVKFMRTYQFIDIEYAVVFK